MRKTFMMIAVALGGVLGLALGTTAASASTVQLHVSPTTVVAGHTVHVSGVCDPNTNGFVISAAFLDDATHDFGGVGAVSFSTDASGAFSGTTVVPSTRAPGTYDVGARCGGGNIGILVHLQIAKPRGTITGVPAGSAGLAATTDTTTRAWQYGIGIAGLLLLAGTVAGLARLRRTHRPPNGQSS